MAQQLLLQAVDTAAVVQQGMAEEAISKARGNLILPTKRMATHSNNSRDTGMASLSLNRMPTAKHRPMDMAAKTKDEI